MTDRLVRTLLPCLIAMCVVGCMPTDRQVIDQANQMHGQLEPAIYTDRDLDAYVQSVGDRIVGAARQLHAEGLLRPRVAPEGDLQWMFSDVQFHLVNSQTFNAFTTGGQHVYMYSELFRRAKTEHEYAAVVAHEFAHIYGRHVHGGMRNNMMVMGAAAAAAAGGYALGGENREQLAMMLGGGAMVAGNIVGVQFTRRDEQEADALGFQMYVRAGYDPDQFGGIFRSLLEAQGGTEAGGQLAFLNSHPQLGDRIRAAEQRAAELGPDRRARIQPTVASQQRFEALQARSTEIGNRMPDDKSLQGAQLLLNAFPSCLAVDSQPTQVDARNRLMELLVDDHETSR